MNTSEQYQSASQAVPTERAAFIRKTYAHLAGALLLFVLLEAYLIHSPLAGVMLDFMGSGRFAGLGVLAVFMLVTWQARGLIAETASVTNQYVGLSLYVIAYAIFFIPIIHIAAVYSSPDVLPTAGILTLLLFGGLTAVVFTTRKDFSFLGSILTIVGFVVLGLIVCSAIFGLTLGLAFSAAMVIFASAAILYDTSKVLHNYRTDQYVGAAASLFASVLLLFMYILRIVMGRR